MHLTPDQLLDLTTLTLNRIKKRQYSDISMELPEYIVPRILKNYLILEQGGPYIEFKVKHRNLGNAHHSGLWAEGRTSNRNIMITGLMPWRKQETSFSYDIDEEIFQSDEETIVSEMVTRVHAMECDMVELDEDDFWQAPSDSTDDRPAGVPYWIVKDPDTTPLGGFNGGNPSGHAAGCANINSSTYSGYKNYTFGYDSISPTNLIRRAKKAMRATRFKPPVPFPELKWGESKVEIFTTEPVIDELERMAEGRNDNHGTDVARYMNQVVINSVPVTEVPWLTANDGDDPLYGINFGYFRPYGRKNRFQRRTKPMPAPKQPTVRDVFLHTWKNYGCFDRRRQWVGSK
jgi:hypothetical protein